MLRTKDFIGEYFAGKKSKNQDDFNQLINFEVDLASKDIDTFSVIFGSTPSYVSATLNFAIGFLERGEAYLEIGSYCGKSMCGALDQHFRRSAYAIDDFGYVNEGQSVSEIFNKNISELCDGRVTCINKKYDELLSYLGQDNSPISHDIGVFYFNVLPARFSSENIDVSFMIKTIEPHLADNAIIFIDHASDIAVTRALEEIMTDPKYSLITIMGFGETQAILLFQRGNE